MRKTILFLILSMLAFSAFSQVNITSPAATEFVKSQRIPVSYFNGLPTINIPLYTANSKDLELPITLNYYASGIKVNQYPTYMGLGWNMNAGGCITRIINGLADETILQDYIDMTGIVYSGNDLDPGYYYSSFMLDENSWASEQQLIKYNSLNNILQYDWEPDEFVVNAYGVNGSFYFYRDKNKQLHTKIKSCNGEKFRVSEPIIKTNPEEIQFHSSASDKDLKSYKTYRLFYEFTITKQDGTRLIFGGDNDCIEFVSEKRMQRESSNLTRFYLKTLPTSWMLREIISPKGNKIKFTYQRNGNPIILNDVITDLWRWDANGNFLGASQDKDRGKSFHVLHPVYPQSIVFDNDLKITFSISQNNDLNTVREEDLYFLKYTGFTDHFIDQICYEDNGSFKTPYEPHNYFCHLTDMTISNAERNLFFYTFNYTQKANERIKLTSIVRNNSQNQPEYHKFTYNPLLLPDYNATLTDNWGFYNGKDYRSISIENGLYQFRSANETLAQAEILTSISYPTGGKVDFCYELNDYSFIATQVPDFKLETESGKAGGLRIKQITYTDTCRNSELTHYFEYQNEDGSSSGILSGVPRYVTEGKNHTSFNYSDWDGLVHFKIKDDINQTYKMLSERYINVLGSTNGNHVTYSRVVEKIGKDQPLKKVYYYSNHNVCPDTADYEMYTNIDEVDLDNKFTSKAAMRGLLIKEVWYNDNAKVKEIENLYSNHADDKNDFMRCVDCFSIPGITGHFIYVPFVRLTPYKIWTNYPYLKQRIETVYDPSGNTVIQTQQDKFTYNANLLVTSHETYDSKANLVLTTFRYPQDITLSGSIYDKMENKGMIGIPIEILEYRNGKLCSGRLTTYAEKFGIIVPQKTFRLGLTEPIDASAFSPYNGSIEDKHYLQEHEMLDTDKYGNPMAVREEDGVITTYLWDYPGRYPVMKVRNAHNSYNSVTVYENVWKNKYITLSASKPSQNVQKYTIRTYREGSVQINLPGMLGYNWYVAGRFDGKPFSLVQCRANDSDYLPWSDYKKAYSGNIEFLSVAAGEHTIEITATICNDINATLPGELNFYYWDRKSHVETTGHDECLYEGFESFSGSDYIPFGYHSKRSYIGTYNIRLKGYPDKPLLLDYQVYRNGKWNYIRKEILEQEFSIDEGINPIDEIRVYPQGTQVTSYSYIPFVGMKSMTDGRGITESYGYDYYQRLRSVADNKGNLKKAYSYHYQNQPSKEYLPVYYNEAIQRNFYCSSCDSTKGERPLPVAYEVPERKYVSNVSQEEANRMAVDDLLKNGQRYADEKGECDHEMQTR